MGNQKLKWTAEEEETLLSGVRKHGPGKWKNILRDPEFADQLSNRSNIDLKDKWRNLSVAPGIQGSKDKVRTPKIKAAALHLAAVAAAAITPPASAHSSPVAVLPRSESSDLSIDDSCNVVVDAKNAPRYDGMIFEALSSFTDPNGSDVGAIFNFIEQQKHEVPQNFRRILSSRLRRLAAQGKLQKTQNFYKMNDNSCGIRTPLVARPKEGNAKHRQINNQGPTVSQEMVAEASKSAAYKLVEVENKSDVVKGAGEEIERTIKFAEKTNDMLLIAAELHERCCQGEIVDIYYG